MQKTLFITGVLLLTFSTLQTTAQKKVKKTDFSEDVHLEGNFTLEVGTSWGVMNCLTDIGGAKKRNNPITGDLTLQNSLPDASIYFTGHYKNALGFRAEAIWGAVKANDKVLASVKDAQDRYSRNLNFRSTIFEIMVGAEVHPFYLNQLISKRKKILRFSPYVTGGIGLFVFDPKTKYNNTWVALHPLRTEGQGFSEYPSRKHYKLKQFNFPVGGGITYKLIPNCNLSVEFLYRFLDTDYLDDVSTNYIDPRLFKKYLPAGSADIASKLQDRQKELDPTHITNVGDTRGNPGKKDSYYSLNVRIGILF